MVQSLRKLYELANRFCVCETVLEVFQLGLGFALPALFFYWFDILAPGYGEDIQFVVEDKAIVARTEGKNEAFVEACDDGVMSGGTIPSVNILVVVLHERADGCTKYRRRRTIVMVYSCRSELIVFNKITTKPPPSTVSIVRASKFGVIASKSCSTHIPYV